MVPFSYVMYGKTYCSHLASISTRLHEYSWSHLMVEK